VDRFGRRILLGGTLPLLVPGVAAAAQPIPPIPLFIRVATHGKSDEPVASAAFVDALISETNAVYAEHELSFVEARDRGSVPSSRAALETRADRDGLAEHFESGITNVFVVRSLRDVDDPKLYRMGVMWRFLKNLKKKYVIVAASCMPTTLAHELGHFLGLDHAYVKNNLMSYDRDEGAKVFLDAKQGEKCRRTARGLFAKKELVPAGDQKGE
jgi:hypothetical protein